MVNRALKGVLFGAAQVGIRDIRFKYCPMYVIADVTEHDLAGELKFCLKLCNFCAIVTMTSRVSSSKQCFHYACFE